MAVSIWRRLKVMRVEAVPEATARGYYRRLRRGEHAKTGPFSEVA